MPNFNDLMKDVEALGKQEVDKLEARMIEWQKDPVKYAIQIKFFGLALKEEQKILSDIDSCKL